MGFFGSRFIRMFTLNARVFRTFSASRIRDGYFRLNDKYPIATAISTSAALWITGDTIAQNIEMRAGNQPFDAVRLFGTTLEGSIVNGGLGCIWYKFLDNFVSHRLMMSSGSVKFVLTKVGLECLIWHPLSLLTFWVVVGGIEGHSLKQIKEELKRDYLPTLLGEFALWTPLDLLNFWLVPVKLQVLVGNGGCLLEAVCLSYIHACGFPSLGNSTSDTVEHNAHLAVDDSPVKRMDSLPSRPAVISHLASRLSSDALNMVALDDNLSASPVASSSSPSCAIA